MKLILACLLAGASLANVCLATDPTTEQATKNWCPTGEFKSISTIRPSTSTTDLLTSCKIARGIAITIDNNDGGLLPAEAIAAIEKAKSRKKKTDEDDDATEDEPNDVKEGEDGQIATSYKHLASTVTLSDSTVGVRTTIAIRGVQEHERAKHMVPLFVNIQNNAFDTDGHIFVRGALPSNSQIAITGNTFKIARPLDARYPGGFLNTTAIAIALDEVYFYDQSAIRIVNNEINARDNKGRFALHGVSIRSQVYWYGTNSSLDITHNRFDVQCKPELFNNTLCGFGVHSDQTMYMYTKDSALRLDHNDFKVSGGLLFRMPSILAHLASVLVSVSHNKGQSFSEKNPSSCLVRRYTPFAEFGITNMGAQSQLHVDYNSFKCNGKSGILGFPTDFTITDFVFASIRGNEISTVGCSPSIYFMNTFSLALKSILWIHENVQSRADHRTSGLASVYFAGEFSVQHESEFTINKNVFGKPKSIKPKTKMVGLAPSAINSWRVEEGASINICENTYNGELLVEEHDLKPHIALKMQEVVMVDDCRTEPRPYSDDYEPGGAEDIPADQINEFGDDQAQTYTKAIIQDQRPEIDTENNNEDGDDVVVAASPSISAESAEL